VTGATVLVAVETTGDSAPVTGARACAVALGTGITVLVTGVSVLAAAAAAGVTAPVTGATVLVAVETTDVTAPVTGARALVTVDPLAAVALVTGVVPAGLSDDVAAAVAGARVFVTAATTGVTTLAPVTGAVEPTADADGAAGAVTEDVAWPVVPTGGVAAGGAGGGGAGGWGCSGGAVTWTGGVVAVPVTVLTMDPATLATGSVALEVAGEAEPVIADTAAETVGRPGGWSPVAAWACFERTSRRNRIPAAAIANCAARRATRRAIGCDIDSSQSLGYSRLPPGCLVVKYHESPGPARRLLQTRHFCPATTVHETRYPDKRDLCGQVGRNAVWPSGQAGGEVPVTRGSDVAQL
jgi:hypothetical protein